MEVTHDQIIFHHSVLVDSGPPHHSLTVSGRICQKNYARRYFFLITFTGEDKNIKLIKSLLIELPFDDWTPSQAGVWTFPGPSKRQGRNQRTCRPLVLFPHSPSYQTVYQGLRNTKTLGANEL